MTRLGRATASRPPFPGARAGLSFLLLLLLLLSPLAARAAVYTFSGSNPGSGFPACSVWNGVWEQSGSIWTCNGSTSLAAGDSISPSGSITVVATAGITLGGNNAIGTASASVSLTTAHGNLTGSGSGSVFRGNLTAGSGSINLSNATVHGAVTGASGSITLTNVTVNGTVTKTGGGGSITITGGSITGTVSSAVGISASGGTVFGSSVTASGSISLAGGSVAGSVSGNNGVTATGGVIFSGSVTSSNGSISLAGGSVAGNVNGNNGVTATGGVTLSGNVTASSGAISLTGGSVVGQVHSTCCAVTTNNTNVGNGIRSDNNTVTINGGTVSGAIYSSGGGGITINNATIPSGSVITSNVAINVSGSTLGSPGSPVNVSSNNAVTINNSVVYGNVTGGNWSSAVTISNSSTVHGVCTSNTNSNVNPGQYNDRCEGGLPTGSAASGFQAIDEAYGDASGASKPTIANWQTGHIYTKLAGVPFKLNVAALKKNGDAIEVVTDYVASDSKWLQVKLVDNSNGACVLNSSEATYCDGSCVGKAAVDSQIMIYASTDAGQKQSANFTVATAQRALAVVMRECSDAVCSGFTATPAACAIDLFAVRPRWINLKTNDASQVGTSGAPVFRAGEDTFFIELEIAKGYDGTPKIDNILPVSPAAVAGSISGILRGAIQGDDAATMEGTFTYDEVGVFRLPGHDPATDATSLRGILDDIWTAIDKPSDDCVTDSYSNTKDGNGKYGCLFGLTANQDFGRFIPHHLGVTGVLINRSDLATSGGSFTYMGEPMRVALTVTAYNKANGKTENYLGGFAKLNVGAIASDAWFRTDCERSPPTRPLPVPCMGLGAVNQAPNLFTNLLPRLSILAGSMSNSAWAGGESTFEADVVLNRSATTKPDGPFDALKLGAKPHDADGVTLLDTDLDLGVTMDGPSERHEFATTKVRFGRLRLTNAYGSVSPLKVPAEAQYWSGRSWVKNGDDSLTSLVDFPVNDWACAWTAPTPSATLVSGLASIDVTASSAGTCFLTLGVPAWLQGNWGGNAGYTANPSAKVTFGVFSPEHKRTIHIRELY